MHLPSLHSPSLTHYCVSGNVAIAADVTIAAGVVLMADVNSAIVIASGACVGLGSVLHAYQGEIIVEAGASLGAGVLVVGRCRIGTQACVGTSTTIYNANVAPGALVPPASLLGNRAHATPEPAHPKPPKIDKVEPEPSPWDVPESVGDPAPSSAPESAKAKSSEPEVADARAQSPSPPKAQKVVYGKAQFDRMRGAMGSP